jgi:hypothetical protein
MPNNDEFEIGRGSKSVNDNFSLHRSWQKGYQGFNRFTPSYIRDCYSQDPQAVFKVISFGRGKSQLKRLVEYVNTRDGRAQEFYTESGEALKGQDDIEEIVNEWSQEFRTKGSGRGKQRHFTHGILSAYVEPTRKNALKVLAAAEQTLREEFGESGFRYTYVLHNDTEHPHVHFILNNYNQHHKRKLSLDRHDFSRIRSDFAINLVNRGLKHVATLRRDRPEIFLSIQQTKQKIYREQTKLANMQIEYSNRKSTLKAHLSKEITKKDYDNLSVSINNHKNNTIIEANKPGAHIEKILTEVANKNFSSKDNYIDINKNNAAIIIKNNKTTYSDKKDITNKFNQIVKRDKFLNKQNFAVRSQDMLPKYESLLKQTNRAIGWTKRANLSIYQKQELLSELKITKKQILSGYDLKEMNDLHTMVSSHLGKEAAKEILSTQKQKPTRDDTLKRNRALDAYIKQHKADMAHSIEFYDKRNNKEMVALLKGMKSARDYKSIIDHNNKVKHKAIQGQIK